MKQSWHVSTLQQFEHVTEKLDLAKNTHHDFVCMFRESRAMWNMALYHASIFSQNRLDHGGPDAVFSERIRPWHVIMVGPWMISSLNGLNHGCYHAWAMDALFSECMLSSQDGLDHGRHHGWAMDVLPIRMRPEWTLLRLGHGCSDRTDEVGTDALAVGAWVLSRMRPEWTPLRLQHRCSDRTDAGFDCARTA